MKPIFLKYFLWDTPSQVYIHVYQNIRKNRTFLPVYVNTKRAVRVLYRCDSKKGPERAPHAGANV